MNCLWIFQDLCHHFDIVRAQQNDVWGSKKFWRYKAKLDLTLHGRWKESSLRWLEFCSVITIRPFKNDNQAFLSTILYALIESHDILRPQNGNGARFQRPQQSRDSSFGQIDPDELAAQLTGHIRQTGNNLPDNFHTNLENDERRFVWPEGHSDWNDSPPHSLSPTGFLLYPWVACTYYINSYNIYLAIS